MLGPQLRWLLWTAAMGVFIALAYQARYAAGAAECVRDGVDRLVLCAGPLPGWLLPATLVAGLILTLLPAWRLTRTAG